MESLYHKTSEISKIEIFRNFMWGDGDIT